MQTTKGSEIIERIKLNKRELYVDGVHQLVPLSEINDILYGKILVDEAELRKHSCYKGSLICHGKYLIKEILGESE